MEVLNLKINFENELTKLNRNIIIFYLTTLTYQKHILNQHYAYK